MSGGFRIVSDTLVSLLVSQSVGRQMNKKAIF